MGMTEWWVLLAPHRRVVSFFPTRSRVERVGMSKSDVLARLRAAKMSRRSRSSSRSSDLVNGSLGG